MKETWLEIYDILSYCITNKVLESDYQKEVENCFKILGWKKSNKTLQSQQSMPIGCNKYIRPDIILQKSYDNSPSLIPVIVIEIKRPDNNINERQELQLFSYMRQARLNVGLFIGKNIQLFYDTPENNNLPTSVLTIEINKEERNGELFCELLDYKNFDLTKIESYCEDLYRKQEELTRLRSEITDFFNNYSENLKNLLRTKFLSEKFSIQNIDLELSKLKIEIPLCTPNTQVQSTCMSNIEYKKKENKNYSKKDNTQYSFDGGKTFYGKGRFVLSIIQNYVENHPMISFDELENIFPSVIINKKKGVIKRYSDVCEMIKKSEDIKKRYFVKDLIKLHDGTLIAVNTQWGIGTSFSKFQHAIKDLYTIIKK